MFRALILDDKKGQLENLVPRLQRFPDLSLAYLKSFTQALDLVELGPPDLILATLDSEEPNGFQLIRELKGRLGEVPEILFHLSECAPGQRELLDSLDLGIFSIQGEAHRILRTIQHRIERKKRAIPSERLSFSDVEPQILLALMSGKDVWIQVLDREGPRGELMVSGGGIWAAHDSEGTGPTAFLRLLDRGERATCSLISPELLGPNDFDREDDEDVQDLIDQGIEAILKKELKEAAKLFMRAKDLAPDNGLVKANLQRLSALGMLPSSSG